MWRCRTAARAAAGARLARLLENKQLLVDNERLVSLASPHPWTRGPGPEAPDQGQGPRRAGHQSRNGGRSPSASLCHGAPPRQEKSRQIWKAPRNGVGQWGLLGPALAGPGRLGPADWMSGQLCRAPRPGLPVSVVFLHLDGGDPRPPLHAVQRAAGALKDYFSYLLSVSDGSFLGEPSVGCRGVASR